MGIARPGNPAAGQGCPDQALSGDVSASALGDDAERAAHAIAAARQALGQQLATLRRAAGHSQKDFAPLTGYGRSTVANVETGHQNVPRAFWERCAQALSADMLIAGYDQLQAMVFTHREKAAKRTQAARDAKVRAWHQARQPYGTGRAFEFVPLPASARQMRSTSGYQHPMAEWLIT